MWSTDFVAPSVGEVAIVVFDPSPPVERPVYFTAECLLLCFTSMLFIVFNLSVHVKTAPSME